MCNLKYTFYLCAIKSFPRFSKIAYPYFAYCKNLAFLFCLLECIHMSLIHYSDSSKIYTFSHRCAIGRGRMDYIQKVEVAKRHSQSMWMISTDKTINNIKYFKNYKSNLKFTFIFLQGCLWMPVKYFDGQAKFSETTRPAPPPLVVF